ncbi:MAG: hypothetical protein HEP71_29415 [Roseivirga sp.]|nr:hypothetical protein [Roseivirga sp.]
MKHRAFLFLFTFVLLLPTLLGETVLWDDTYLVSTWDRNDPFLLVEYFDKLGMPWQGWLHYYLSFLPYKVTFYKLFSVLSWSACSVLAYQLLAAVPFFTPRDRFYIALIASLFPGFNLWFSIIQMPQPLYVAIFLAGCYAYWQGSMNRKWLLKTVGLLLILPTFALQSLYVYLYGLIFVWFWFTKDVENGFLNSAFQFTKQHLAIILLPVIQFMLLKVFFPIDPIFGTYNVMQFDKAPFKLLVSLGVPPLFILREAWNVFTKDWQLFVGLLAMSLIFVKAALVIVKPAKLRGGENKSQWRNIIAAGIFLAICGVFPYALVNKPYLGINYTGRFAMLLAWPVSLILYGLIRYRFDSSRQLVQKLITIVCVVFCFLTFKDQVLWHTRYIKYIAMTRQIEGEEDKMLPLVFFNDQTTIGKPAPLIYFELNWIMNRAWNNPDHFGFSSFQNHVNKQMMFEELEQIHYFKNLKNSFFQELMLFSKKGGEYNREAATLITVRNGQFDSNLRLWLKWISGSNETKRKITESLIEIEIKNLENHSDG